MQLARLVPGGRLAQAAPGASRRVARAARIDRDRTALDRRARPLYTRDMTIKRLDHVSVVVDDLAAAIAFFTALGMTIEGETRSRSFRLDPTARNHPCFLRRRSCQAYLAGGSDGRTNAY